MAGGEGFSLRERQQIERAVTSAREVSGVTFSVYVGAVGEPLRAFAERLHASLDEPDRSVALVVDPVARHLEIVTGAGVRYNLADADCALVALNMQTAFAAGDLVDGIATGVQQLADHARRPATMHLDES